jgi:hypothetical protein
MNGVLALGRRGTISSSLPECKSGVYSAASNKTLRADRQCHLPTEPGWRNWQTPLTLGFRRIVSYLGVGSSK